MTHVASTEWNRTPTERPAWLDDLWGEQRALMQLARGGACIAWLGAGGFVPYRPGWSPWDYVRPSA